MSLHVNNGGNWVAPVSVSTRVAGAWIDVQEVLVKQGGAWVSVWQAEALVVLTSRSTSVDLRSLFDATTWSSNRKKRVLVPAGVTINASDWRGALYLAAGTAWDGVLTVDVYGSLYGIGGVALSNSGEGGAAIGSEIAGASGQRVIVNVYSGGQVKAGGGAGGQGGTGGAGSYSYATYDSGYVYDPFSWQHPGTEWIAYNLTSWALSFANSWIASSDADGWADRWSYQVGNTMYYRGDLRASLSDENGTQNHYSVRRLDYATAGSSGGAGGYGGRGQGSDGAAASGVSGAAGGTNAGTGGTGGTGGAWGAQGGTGSAGAAGNAGSGASGASGGLGGRYAYGWLTINNAGAVAGRLALS